MSERETAISVIVADDEPPALRGLSRMIGERPGFRVIQQCLDGAATLRAIAALRPDLVMLDIEMPGVSGIDVARAAGSSLAPAVVFVTAHPKFAIPAFDVHAVDYLLKPYSEARLDAALRHARRVVEIRRRARKASRSMPLANESPGKGAPDDGLECLVVRSVGKAEVVPLDDVILIEAARYCVRLHVRNRVIVHRESMRSLETRLPPHQFVRVHRSTLANVRQIREVRGSRAGKREVVLKDGAALRVSRSRWIKVMALLERWSQGVA